MNDLKNLYTLKKGLENIDILFFIDNHTNISNSKIGPNSSVSFIIKLLVDSMSINDNGFPLVTIAYTSDINYVTEGALIGMIFGWIVGVVLFYVLGICFIRYIFKRFFKQQTESSSSSKEKRSRKGSSSNSQQMGVLQKKLERQKEDSKQVEPKVDQKIKRKRYEQNPTMEMINTTHENNEENFSKTKSNRKNVPYSINLNLQEKIEN